MNKITINNIAQAFSRLKQLNIQLTLLNIISQFTVFPWNEVLGGRVLLLELVLDVK